MNNQYHDMHRSYDKFLIQSIDMKLLPKPHSGLHHLQDALKHKPIKASSENIRLYQEMILSGHIRPIIVAHDFRDAVPTPTAYEQVRLPFPLCCWEFSFEKYICMAFTITAEGTDFQPVLGSFTFFVALYDKALACWGMSNAYFFVKDGILQTRTQSVQPQTMIFARRCYDMIRASCIMIDAGIFGCNVNVAPPTLVKNYIKKNKMPPRDFVTINLLKQRQVQHCHVAGAPTGTKTPQRGHWRCGTYVHFNDPDSGKEIYVDEGGFFHSRTYRSWHFAGDPKNIIRREYRV